MRLIVLAVLAAGIAALAVFLLRDDGTSETPAGAARDDASAPGERPLLVGSEPAAALDAPPSGTPPALADPLVVAGRVLDERRRPVAGARVEGVLDGGGPAATATTGADGRYELVLGERPRETAFGSLR